jgi:Fic family protein
LSAKYNQNLELESRLRMPALPPDVDDILTRLVREGDSKRLATVLGQNRSEESQTKYLHWDKLRYKQPPAELTADEWWLRIKWGRRAIAREVELLLSKAGRPLWYCLPDLVLESVDNISRRASGDIVISEQVTNAQTRDTYIVSSLIEEAITSSQLEGAVTSRRVAKDMIRSGRTPTDRSERMILNNYNAMRRVSELRKTDMTPELVCEIHRIVTENTLDDPSAAGRLQAVDEDRVAIWSVNDDELLHQPPPASELPDRLRRLCEFANGGGRYMPPVLRAIAAHFMFGYDHYFEDGNGRTARALFYWSMLRQGYWLAEFITISRILKNAPAKYTRSFLLTETDEGDLTYFFIYQLGVIERAITELHVYLAKKAQELREAQERIRALPGEFNYRQLALLEHAIKNPNAMGYSAKSHARSHNVTTETARTDLAALERRGYLVQRKIGRRFIWLPAPDLPSLLPTPAA